MIIKALLVALPFHLGMTVKQVRAACPKPLMTVYERLYTETHFVCDDGKNSTVLIFGDKGKLAAIMELRYFAERNP